MKILFFTDTHLRSSTPQNRLDNLPEVLKAKLAEVVSRAREGGADLIIHGGDLFDHPNPGLAQAGEYLAILRELPAPMYIVAGNHDIYGGNLATLPRTLLGLLTRLGYLRLLTPDQPLLLEEAGIRVRISGQGYDYELDRDPERRGYSVSRQGADCFIHVVHGMLLERGGFPGECTLIDDIAGTAADITLSGHYHLGFGLVERAGRRFINPGALVRLTNHPLEIERQPAIAWVEIGSGINCELVPLSAASPGDQVLSREAVEQNQSRLHQMEMFTSEIRAAADLKRVNVEQILEELIADHSELPERVKMEARARLARAQAMVGGGRYEEGH